MLEFTARARTYNQPTEETRMIAAMNQKEAVFNVVSCFCTQFAPNGAHTPSKSELAQIHSELVTMFKEGKITLKANFSEPELKKYVVGLVNNWLRKDQRLNGGTTWVTKNPGARSGSGDPQIKALKALLSTVTDPADRAEIQHFIDLRSAEIAKPAKPAIDFSQLPAELAAKFKA